MVSTADEAPRPRARRPDSPRVTAATVAREAGVSTATVSLVVSGKARGRVSAGNQAKVEAAIARLGYVVDSAGSTLSKGFSPVVLLIATDITNPFYAGLIASARAALGERYELLLSVSDPGSPTDPASIPRLLSQRPAGCLIHAPSAELVARLPAGTRAVLLDAPGLAADWPTVNLDVAGGASELARHLAGLGHRRVGYLDSVVPAETFRVRREAFRATAAESGLEVAHPVRSLTDAGDAARVFTEHWPAWRDAGVSVVVGCTDTHALGVLSAARAAGIGIPAELAVAGFDNLPYSRDASPGLTTVDFPAERLGRAAGEALRSLIEGDPAQPPPRITLESRLIPRGSTLGPRGDDRAAADSS
ncbi:LacI family DNA-binding transcriptional regulator [Phaeacidiphilus oryzae]|uniref:LacI family DNA-binding transcriptional regulator n=1 Tax=Phaeacidiphilus oryzae TaxID=348818 RepID=UPI00068EA4AE|nr:LacI family DNA-binding transcriptional regulator [Phaeacidiphilus oryzae]